MATLVRSLGAANPFAAGANPYGAVEGNPIVALIAQVNRFAGKTIPCSVSSGAASGGLRVLNNPLPLTPVVTGDVAYAAAQITYARYNCSGMDFWSDTKSNWVLRALQSDTIAWVNQNLNELTVTLAQYGDSQGYPPADVGITKVDEKVTPKKLSKTTVVSVGAIFTIVGAALSTWRKL